jgi:hypothetical protein
VTHLELSRKLNTSKSNIQRMVTLGMPTSTEAAARAWIEARSKDNPQQQAAQTLAEQRKEKIRLECALLSLRLQREQDNCELLPASECLDAVRAFLRFCLINLKQKVDASAEQVAACSTPNEVHKQLAELTGESWILSALTMAQQTRNVRLSRMMREVITSEFVLIDAKLIESWIGGVDKNATSLCQPKSQPSENAAPSQLNQKSTDSTRRTRRASST